MRAPDLGSARLAAMAAGLLLLNRHVVEFRAQDGVDRRDSLVEDRTSLRLHRWVRFSCWCRHIL